MIANVEAYKIGKITSGVAQEKTDLSKAELVG